MTEVDGGSTGAAGGVPAAAGNATAAAGNATAAAGEVFFPRLHRLVTPLLFALAGVLIASGMAFLSAHYTDPPLPLDLLVAAQAVPLLFCRRHPVAAWAVTVAASLGTALAATPLDPKQPWPWTPVAIIAFLTVHLVLAASRPWWLPVTAWGVVIGATGLVPAVADRPAANGNVTLIVMLTSVATLAGQIVRVRRQARVRVLRHEQLSAQERARRQVLEERARIARELHDVVAHHMSVIAVQASTAAYRIDGLPDAARAEFESIGDSARDSLTEMRRLLAVLRGHDSGAERAPQPDLGRLAEVVEATRRAGCTVSLEVRQVPADLPDAVGLSAFRIVQEALSNVIRHAPGATVRVEVIGGAAHLTVLVDNEPSPGRTPAPAAVTGGPDGDGHGTGHGLTGMRERAAMLGGELVAHPRTDGGFRVRAVLPLA
ncbi:sensor histidine kinase [Planosporangium sp. 12N6]|uniref:sensor histidine kinase n=1 Tax=Planosporangium spinosum TaxID=3402278 RepID=UPI003CF861AC